MFPRGRAKPSQWRKYAIASIVIIISLYFMFGSAFVSSESDDVVLPLQKYVTIAEGVPQTPSYAVYTYLEGSSTKISNWHDVPLRYKGGKVDEFNYVNEIPFGTRAKMETQTKLPNNPIKQDTKDGVLREYKYGDTFFNYGALPQTWEDPYNTDIHTGAGGDNDPVDVMEVGSRVLGVGEVTQVRVLGSLGLVDGGEIDWKILCICLSDPKAGLIFTLDDLKKHDPGKLERIYDWLINYKTAEGKGKNTIEPKDPLTKEESLKVIEETHQSWKMLRGGRRPPRTLWTGVDPQEQEVSLALLLSVAEDLARQAGLFIKTVSDAGTDLERFVKGKTKEGVEEPLTIADTGSHKIIMKGLRDTWNGALKVVSEEEAAFDGDEDDYSPKINAFEYIDENYEHTVKLSDVTVWVDPLDATKEFTEHLTQYVTVMVGIAVKGRAVGGVVHYPFEGSSGLSTWGLENLGFGGFDRVEPPPTAGSKPRIVVSMSHPGVIEAAIEAVGGTKIDAAGAGYKTLFMLSGKADAYLHRTKIKKWDLCAPNGIVNAAKGRMTDWDDNEFDYRYNTDAANEKGVLATLANHKTYLEKLRVAGIKPQ